MDLQKIEPLLIDYALDVAPPEVMALVEAYVEKDAVAGAQLVQWQSVVGLARRAILNRNSTLALAAIPVFPRRRLQTAQRRTRMRKGATWAAALAACLTLGFFAGSQTQRQPNATAAASGNQKPALGTAERPIAAVRNFGSLAWRRAMVQQIADRPEQPSNYALKDLMILYHPTGG
ncbi:MAG TPA: hypothetical protein VFE46_17025 [Pirellulales bacterium]|jgi:hypothetical protein|nr:hypothetical protein [Pirellulales bacterium]